MSSGLILYKAVEVGPRGANRLCRSAPVATRRPDDGRQQTERQVDRDDQPDLVQAPARFGQIVGPQGIFEAAVGREPEVQVEQDHRKPRHLHNVDMNPNRAEAAEDDEDHPVAA